MRLYCNKPQMKNQTLEVFQIYIYPNNLKAKPTLWLWALRDVAVIGVGFVLSVLALAHKPPRKECPGGLCFYWSFASEVKILCAASHSPS